MADLFDDDGKEGGGVRTRTTSDAPPSKEADEALQTMVSNLIGDRTGLRTLKEIEDGLSQEIPTVYLGEKYKGGGKITIFDWILAQDMLDYWAPGWQNYNDFVVSAERVVCTTRICIPTADRGIVCRSASGDDTEDEDEMPDFDLSTEEGQKAKKRWEGEQRGREYGSPTTRAEGQAFKRACARFGLGMHLRRKKPRYMGPSSVGGDAKKPYHSNDVSERPQRNAVAQQRPVEKPATDPSTERFEALWRELQDAGWTNPQIKAQYAQVAGNERFSTLPHDVQDAAIAKLQEMVDLERRNKKGVRNGKEQQ